MRSKGVAMNTGEKIDYMIQCLQVAKGEEEELGVMLRIP